MVLEALQAPGSHVGVLSSGSAKRPSRTGTRNHARFIPIVKVCINSIQTHVQCYTGDYSTIFYSRSVDPRKLCVGVKYYIVHMYSMPYYTYGSTANLLFLGPTALTYIYISKEWRCDEDLCGVGNVKIE